MHRRSIDQWLDSRDDDNTLRVDNGGSALHGTKVG